MKISELIEKLTKIKEKHGDIPVLVEEEGYGGHALHTLKCDKRRVHNLELGTLIWSDEPNEELIKELFPDWDGNMESEQQLEIKYVELSTGKMLYST